MKKIRLLFTVKLLFLATLLTFPELVKSQNHALTATASHSGGGATIYDASNYNDGVVTMPTGLPWGWVTTNGWIEYTWTTPVPINSLVFYKDNRPMTSADLEYWDGSNYVNFYTYNSSVTPMDSINFPTITTTRLRINNVSGSSNPNHREIRAYFISSGANDASVLSIDSPGVFCGGIQNVVATIGNVGLNQINNVDVHWEINGVPQPTFSYRSLLDTVQGTNPSSAQVTLGSYNFPNGSTEIKVYTSNPNGVADTTNANDTLVVQVGPALAGNYTVDASQPTGGSNFNSFSDLSSFLNQFGICAPTYVDVVPGVYNDILDLNRVPGLSSVNTLTIDGADSSLVTLENGLANSTFLVGINNSPYVTVKNMTLQSFLVSTTDHFGVHLSGGTHHDSLVNLHILVDDVSTTGPEGITASGSPNNAFSEGDNAHFTTIMNCRIEGGDYSIHFEGGSAGNWNAGNQFINNTLVNADQYAIYIDEQDSIDIIGNHISGIRQTGGYGMYGLDIMNMRVNENYVHTTDYGIYFNDANNTKTPSYSGEFINNMVISDADRGIYLFDPLDIKIYHNSILSSTEALALDGVLDILDIRNNIFYSTGDVALFVDDASTVLTNLDYNLYNTGGTNLIELDGTAYADLPAFQTAYPLFDVSSLEGDPQFASTSNLHIVGAFVNDQGDNSVGVTVDIDGDSRPIGSSTIVDMGADEFVPPTCPPPSNVLVDSLQSNYAEITFGTNTIGNTVLYELVPCGQPRGSGTPLRQGSVTVNLITLSGLQASTCYDFYIREICGRSDSSIWLGPYSFNTPIAGPRGVNCITGAAGPIFTEEFDAPGSWTGDVNTGTTAGDWNFGHNGGTGSGSTGPSGAHSGSNYVYVEASGSAGNPWGTNATMVSPAIDLSQVNDSAELSFWMHAYGQTMGTLTVGVSTTPTGPFTTEFTWSGELQTASTDPWQNVGIRLDNYVGQVIYLQFDFLIGSNFYSDIGIDLLTINGCISCPRPTNLDATRILLDSANLSWDGTSSSYEYSIVPVGTPPGANSTVTSLDSLSVGGLTPGTSYDYYVRSICNRNDTSAWAGPFSFRTATLGTVAGADTICMGDTTIISTSGDCPIFQWQEQVGGVWVDITGATGSSISVSPTSPTSYRVYECGYMLSNTFTVTPISLSAPTTTSNSLVVQCGNAGTDSLFASSTLPGVSFNWYDDSTGGNLVNQGDTLLYTATAGSPTTPSIDTFYVSASTGAGEDSLDASPFAGGNGCGAGNMFDLESNINMDINGFGINCGLALGSPETVEIYTKTGTYDGFQTTPTAWTLLGTFNVISAGPNGVTKVMLNTPLSLPANMLTGVYINFEADYTNIAAGTPYSNADLTVYSGDGLCTPFAGVNTGRGWNGRVYYGGGCESPRTMVVGEVNCVVGIEDLANTEVFEVYPNPSNGLFTLNVETTTEENFNMEVRDVKGKLVYENNVSVNGVYTESMDFSDLAKGVYYLQVKSDNATRVEKLIIQ